MNAKGEREPQMAQITQIDFYMKSIDLLARFLELFRGLQGIFYTEP
jgi:hypothetical protein